MTQLKLNEPVTFGKSGSIRDMDPYGFDLSEHGISWTQDELAGFSASVAGPVPLDAILCLTVTARPFIQPGKIEHQQLFVFVNGLFVSFRTLTAAEDMEFVLPSNAFASRGLCVEFVIPTASSPKSLGISQDIRKLGIAVTAVLLKLQKSVASRPPKQLPGRPDAHGILGR